MDFAPWGSKSDARYPRGQGDTYPRGQGDTICLLSPWTGGYDMPVARGIRQSRVDRAGFLLVGMLG